MKLSWQSLTLHGLRRVKVEEIILAASTERFHQHTCQKNLGMDSTTLIETASSRSDHYTVCVCARVWYVYPLTHKHTRTHMYSTVILQEGFFFNFPLYFFININQISLLTAVATMHLYKAILLEFVSLICVYLMEAACSYLSNYCNKKFEVNYISFLMRHNRQLYPFWMP